MFVLQMSALFGARPIVVVSDARRAQVARELGAAHVIDRQRFPNWEECVVELTAGKGADVVVEVVGASTFARSCAALATGGRIAIVGYLGGSTLQLDVKSLFIAKRAQLFGQTVGSLRDLETMNRALESARLVPVVDSRYGLDQLDAAIARLAAGDTIGKVIVQVRGGGSGSAQPPSVERNADSR